MNPWYGVVLALALSLPSPALAGRVCPPASLSEPLPGVAEVTLHQASVSTARFPGQWQEGRYGGGKLAYRLFIDGSGTVSDDLRLRGWHVDFTCDRASRRCVFQSTASPPAKMLETARAIGDCLTATPPRARERPARLAAAKPTPSAPPPRQGTAPAPAPAKPWPPAKPAEQATSPVMAKTPGKVAKASAPATRALTTARPAGPPRRATAPSSAVTLPTVPFRQPMADPPADPHASSVLPLPPSRRFIGLRPVDMDPPLFCASPSGAARPTVPDGTGVLVTAPAGPTCWADRLPEESGPARLQRMLLLAGFDAGPVDGRLGGRTRSALVRALGRDRAEAPETEILADLRVLLCGSPDGR